MRVLLVPAIALVLAACAAPERPEDCGRSRAGACRPGMGEEITRRSEQQAVSAISSSVGRVIRRVLSGR